MDEINSEILDRALGYITSRKTFYDINAAYVTGKNPATLNAPKEGNPDNRIPIPLAKMAVDDLVGYAGRGIAVAFDPISSDPDEQETTTVEEYNEVVREWMDYNADAVDTEELYREALSQGRAFQVWWTSEWDMPGFPIRPEYKIVPGDSVFIKYSNEIKPRKEWAAYFWRDPENDDKTIYATVYKPLIAERWVCKNGKWAHDEANDAAHPYTNVPVIEYRANKDKLPIFEAEKFLIDSIDKIAGKSINEVDRFNSLILLLPALASPEMKAKLQELRVLDGLEHFEHWPEFLEKNLSGVTEFYKWSEEFLEKSFRKSIKVPDMTDSTFGTSDQSGVSRMFKLLGMEFVAAGIETYFRQGIYERKAMFDDVINAGTSGIDCDIVTINAKFTRNLPVAEMDKLQIANMMKALNISDETIIKMLPDTIIADKAAELAKMEEAAKNRVNLVEKTEEKENEEPGEE